MAWLLKTFAVKTRQVRLCVRSASGSDGGVLAAEREGGSPWSVGGGGHGNQLSHEHRPLVVGNREVGGGGGIKINACGFKG